MCLPQDTMSTLGATTSGFILENAGPLDENGAISKKFSLNVSPILLSLKPPTVIIFDEIQNYGVNVDELEKYENVRVLVNGDCVFFSEDYQRFLLEGEMDSGEEKQKWQFEITVCLEENHEMVSVEKL